MHEEAEVTPCVDTAGKGPVHWHVGSLRVIPGAVMSILDATVVNVALNTLVRELDSTLPTIQWVISG